MAGASDKPYRICGVSSEGAKAVPVVITSDDLAQFELLPLPGATHILLADHNNPHSLRTFSTTMSGFMTGHKIDMLVIRRCTYLGARRSGVEAIKIETLLQLLPVANIYLESPQTVAAALKRSNKPSPSSLFAYQANAYAACIRGTELLK
jgi:hypothetical protein